MLHAVPYCAKCNKPADLTEQPEDFIGRRCAACGSGSWFWHIATATGVFENTERYGRTKVSKIRAAYNDLRAAVRSGDMTVAQEALDRYEPWADYVFGQERIGAKDEWEDG